MKQWKVKFRNRSSLTIYILTLQQKPFSNGVAFYFDLICNTGKHQLPEFPSRSISAVALGLFQDDSDHFSSGSAKYWVSK